jgi:hypothetical protein
MTNQSILPANQQNKSSLSPSELYKVHSSPESVPQGKLLTDLAPKQLARAIHIMFSKRTLKRKLLPIRLDLEPYRAPDFKYVTQSVDEVSHRLEKLPLGTNGMRWIMEYNGELCVQFYGIRNIDLDFDEFVKRVDVSRAGDAFRDVLGINTEVIRRDELGRPTLQIERIAALAQPNYSAFLGKDELDVYKLESIEYGVDEVKNWMRTVCSPNASTVADDSYMSFKRAPDNKTQIEFVALQQFPLPRIMKLFRLSSWKWFREVLTRAAYRNFWRDTVNGLLLRYEGKEIGFGRPVADKTHQVELGLKRGDLS